MKLIGSRRRLLDYVRDNDVERYRQSSPGSASADSRLAPVRPSAGRDAPREAKVSSGRAGSRPATLRRRLT